MTAADLIKRHEGLRLRPYTCTSGRLTIGWGRNLDGNGITEAEAEMMFGEDYARAEREAESLMGQQWRRLDEVRQAVLIDMAFNLGGAGLAKFRNTLAAVRRGAWHMAAVEMLDSRWARQVGHRASRLATMMQTGQWPKESI